MDEQRLLDILVEIIKNDLRPPYYEEAVSIAKDAQMFHAKDSEKQREKLKLIRKTESRDQLDMRVRLTSAITGVALSPIYSYAEQIWRTDGVSKKIETEASERIQALVKEKYGMFFSGSDLHRYCFEAALQFTKIDPNAWTVFQADFGMDGRRTLINDFYPVEVMSNEVRGFEYDKTGNLLHFAFEFKRSARRRDDPKKTKDLSDFYIYGKGESVHIAEVDPDYGKSVEQYEDNGYEKLPIADLGNRTYMQRVYFNETKVVPAIRWSAYLSIESNRKIGETLVASAIPLLDEMLKDNSLLQLTKYLHAHPEKHQYVRRCQHRDEEGLECEGGFYGGSISEANRCKQCKGTGKLMASSESDITTLAWPDSMDNFVDLAKITHYVERPIEILKEFRSIVSEKSGLLFTAVYNQQPIDPAQLTQAETATKVRIEFDKVYNKLSNFAEMISRAWELGIKVGFQYYGSDANPNMAYPSDFKMLSIADLLSDRKHAVEAGASSDIISSIDEDLVRKKYRNAPRIANDIIAFNRWKPWKDKSPEEIALIIQSRDNLDPDRLLWENFPQVVEKLRGELGDGIFSLFTADQQREAMYSKAKEISEEILFISMPSIPEIMFPNE